MTLNRLIKYLNVLVGLALVAALIAGYWTLYRPLPQTSGSLRAPISAEGQIVRDKLGVPHITAKTIEDALFLQGYATAQDRLWQMDTIRRSAAGELAEIAGPAALDADREARKLGLHRIALQQAADAPAEDRALLAAYARGVNYFIETNRNRLPVEFHLLRYEPRAWSISDSLLIALIMFRDLTSTWKDETIKLSMIAGGDRRKVDFLFPPRSGSEFQPGSNAWAIAPSRTAAKRAILANDPHLQWGLPSIWHMVHLRAAGLNVTGVALPGLPSVIIGHNEKIAWGVTNLHFDVQDLYAEQLDLATGRYVFRGKLEQASVERETIAVRGARPVPIDIFVTRHGPVLTDGRPSLALRWTAAERGTFRFPFLRLNQAANFEDFTKALSIYAGPAQNFVYADVSGNIGYQAAGLLPIRRKHIGDLPVDGASGEFEWDGFIPFEAMPRHYNPPSGAIITANQNPFPAKYAYPVSGNFAPHYRARQIESRLAAKKDWKPEDMLSIQTDVYSAFSHFLARETVKAYEARKANNPGLNDAVQLMRDWSGQMSKDHAAALVVSLLFQHVRKAIGERASPGKGIAYEYQMAPAVIESLLRARPNDWVEDWDQLLLRSLVDAVDEGQRQQGKDVKKWTLGEYTKMQIPHPVLGRIDLPGVGRLNWLTEWTGIGPIAMNGSGTTVKQTSRRLGPSMRMIADLGNWDVSLQNITIGESGHVLSSHYKDQWNDYYAGRSFPMQFVRVEAKDTLTVRP